MIDPVEFGKQMGGLVREAQEPVIKRLESLEQAEPKHGKDAEPVLVSDVAKELMELPEMKSLVSLMVAEGIAEYLKENPIKHGKDGEDAIGVADVLIDRDGALVATMTDGRMKSLGVVVGKDGEDGLSVESMEREYDPETHEVVETFVAAGKKKELRYPAGGIRHGGYWREGVKAVAGQTWTDKSVAWIAVKDTSARPATDSPDWQVFANKGRDGDPGRPGKDFKPEETVKLNG